ncbi:MAG: 3D domain-containing protein [Oscillospiraceae bacterium]
MKRTLEKVRAKLHYLRPRLVLGVFVFGLLLVVFTALLSVEVVTVTDSAGNTRTVLTANQKPHEIASMAGMQVGANDEVVYTNIGGSVASVVVNRSFPVYVSADGQSVSVTIDGGREATVQDVLTAANVQMGEHDYAEPALETVVGRDDTIAVHRVAYAERVGRYEVSNEDVDAFVATLEDPAAFTRSKSRIYDVVYQDKVVDGQVTESNLIALNAVYHPYDEPSAGPVEGIPMSSIDGFLGIELDESGIPTSYTSVMKGAVGTAYSASGGRGAGGQGLYCGTVAVDPRVIPYGTRLYITSSYGQFIYGYAIASDTGTAMVEGRVDLDLYFETNAEARAFGKRAIDIYILD